MRYPRQQSNVVGLVEHIINGVTEHPDIFPHNDPAALQTARDEFAVAEAALYDARSQFLQAAALKQERFNNMQREMKKQIKLGAADNTANPENLSIIGWGIKREPQQLEIPASPGNLRITAQSNDGSLCLIWDKSRHSTEKLSGGGPVRCYLIERGSNSVNWTCVSTSFETEVKLLKQPLGCKLEYRVKATNTSGESCPSNTVNVVL